MSRERTLVTCPVCKTDQHIYAGKICKHISDGGLTCSGSKLPIGQIPYTQAELDASPLLKAFIGKSALPTMESYINNREPINLAKAINGIVVNLYYQLENHYWLETDCANYDVWVSLPACVEFEGRRYGKAGWNSDSCKACYSTGRLIAAY